MEWFQGEPKLDDMLSDPLLHRLMKADGIDMRRLCEILIKAASAVASARPCREPAPMGAAS